MSSSAPPLRRAEPQDAAAVRALSRAAYAKWIPAIGREPKPMAADYDLAVKLHWIDLAEDEAGLVALIEMIPMDDHLLIENIAVREDAQGRGWGTVLLAHAAEVARKHGLPELRLYTNAAFATNLDFYRARGFSETHRSGLPDGGVTVHFAKPVS